MTTPRKALNKAYLKVKHSNPTAVQSLETQIYHLVFQLYNLTPEEIAIVVGGKVTGLQEAVRGELQQAIHVSVGMPDDRFPISS